MVARTLSTGGFEGFYDEMSRRVMSYTRWARECIESGEKDCLGGAKSNLEIAHILISNYEEDYGRYKEAIRTKGIRKHVGRVEKLLEEARQ